MRFIVDAQLPPALAEFLRSKGHEAVALRDIGLRDADDPDIWDRARKDGAIIVTKDEDFAQLVAANDDGPVVLWVRTGNLLKRVLLARAEAGEEVVIARDGKPVVVMKPANDAQSAAPRRLGLLAHLGPVWEAPDAWDEDEEAARFAAQSVEEDLELEEAVDVEKT